MSEVTPGEIDAARRWAESVESVSPYQRIISLCNALDARDATITALREQIAGLTAALAPFVRDWGENEQRVFSTSPPYQQVRCDATISMMNAARAALATPRTLTEEESS